MPLKNQILIILTTYHFHRYQGKIFTDAASIGLQNVFAAFCWGVGFLR